MNLGTQRFRGPVREFLPIFSACLILTALLQYFTGGFGADESNHWDEAAHFVSSLAIADYFRTAIGSPPFLFFLDYYSHFPKVAIGHWPPSFEILQAFAFLVFGGSATVAIVLQTLLGALCAAITSAVVYRLLGAVLGVTAGLMVFLSPIFLSMINLVMADTLEAVLVTLTAICWDRYYTKRNWSSSFLFSVIAAGAVLSKGSAVGLVLLPPVYLILMKDFRFLFARKTLCAGLIVGMITAPWYVMTYRMGADGFVYSWGWSYSHLSVPYFIRALVVGLSLPCCLSYVYGIYLCFPSKLKANGQVPQVACYAACSISMIIFIMLAPADMQARYLLPALPSVIIVGLWAAAQFIERLAPSVRGTRSKFIIATIFLGSALFSSQLTQAHSLHSGDLVKEIQSSAKPNVFVLVSGNVEAEGAFVASFAQLDPRKKFFVIRSQKALASSDWMNLHYKSNFSSAVEVAKWVNSSGVGWLVIDEDSADQGFEHNALLEQAIHEGLVPTKMVAQVSHRNGKMILYALPAVDRNTSMSAELATVLRPGHLGLSQ